MALGDERNSLGFDAVEEERDFSKQGITGKVGQFNIEQNQYPQFCIEIDAGGRLDYFQTTALSGMFNTTSTIESILSEEDKDLGIFIYCSAGDKKIRLGKIQPRQVKAFLKLFESNRVIGFLDKDKRLEGDMLYVLSE